MFTPGILTFELLEFFKTWIFDSDFENIENWRWTQVIENLKKQILGKKTQKIQCLNI